MTVYLIHLDEPLPCGVGRNGKVLQSGHYIGEAEDLIGRIMEHMETTWEPLNEPQFTALSTGLIPTSSSRPKRVRRNRHEHTI